MEFNIKCVQINLQHSVAAVSELNNLLSSGSIDICFVQEPYCVANKIAGFSNVYRIIYAKNDSPYAAIIIVNDNLPAFFHKDVSNSYVSCVEIGSGLNTIVIISLYCPPSISIDIPLRYLEFAIIKNKMKKIIVAGDFNAHSNQWADGLEDNRGQQVLEFMSVHNLHLENTFGSITFESSAGQSCIDLTLTNIPAFNFLTNWAVSDEDSLSDHKYIEFRIKDEDMVEDRPKRYAVGLADWDLFSRVLKSLLGQMNFQEVKNKEQASVFASMFIAAINESCKQSIPFRKPKRKAVPWWNSDLSKLRKENNHLRRVYQRTRNSVLRSLRREEYLQKQSEYKSAIKNAKTYSWRKFCTESSKNPWGFVYKMCVNKLRTKSCFASVKLEGNYTADLNSTLTVLMDKFFPRDSSSTDNIFQEEIRRDAVVPYEDAEDDPLFSISEVKNAIQMLVKGKAPGYDQITSEIVHQVFSVCFQELTDLYNICLKFGVFPKEWKNAVVVVIPKSDACDLSNIHSYRPISLLPIFGKILDRLFINRIKWHMEKHSVLSEKQFGFRRQKSAEDAVYYLVNRIKQYLTTFKYVAAISLDITGAFDNAWWPMILMKLRKMSCPKNLYNLAVDYFKERSANLNVGSTHVSKTIVRGCPQGSISGPTFWNILFNDFLKLDKNFEVTDIAFADDSILLYPANSRKEIEDKGSALMQMVTDWGYHYKLDFNPRKTKCIVFSPPYSKTDLYRRTPVIRINDQSIPVVRNLKYLGIILDNKLSWNQHILMIKKKTISTFNALAVISKSTWGLDNHAMKILYDSVFKSIMTYGCNVWGEAVEKHYIKKHLFSAQRIAALRITKAYRTTSFDALCVLAGIVPIDLHIKEKMIHYSIRKGLTVHFGNIVYEEGTYEKNIQYSDLDNPWSRSGIQFPTADVTYDFHIFTDGSKCTSGVGCAFVVFDSTKSEKVFAEQYRLHVNCSVFQAELFALYESIKWCSMQHTDKRFLINCDSKAAVDVLRNSESLHPIAYKIRMLFNFYENLKTRIHLTWVKAHVGNPGNECADELAKHATSAEVALSYYILPQSSIKREIFQYFINIWQNRWNSSNKGRLTHEFFPEVQKRLLCKDLHVNFQTTQFLSGHGRFREYLHRFCIHDSPTCPCGASRENAKHILLECARFDEQRMDLEISVRKIGLNWPCQLKFLISEDQLFDKLLKFIAAIYELI